MVEHQGRREKETEKKNENGQRKFEEFALIRFCFAPICIRKMNRKSHGISNDVQTILSTWIDFLFER